MGTGRRKGKSSLKKLESQLVKLTDPDCSFCPLSNDTSRVCIPVNPALKTRAERLIVLAEAPGGNEERTGLLLSGAAGELLWRELEEVGLERGDFFITNAVKCRPEDNRTPTAREIKVCTGEYLAREIDLISPKFGLALGNAGLKATLGRTGITKHSGHSYESYGTEWVAALHPAAVLRNPRYTSQFKAALLAFSRKVKNEEGVPVTKFHLVNDKDSLRQFIATANQSLGPASIDTETWGTKPKHGRFPGGGLAWWDDDFKVVMIQISFKPGVAWVIPLWHAEARWKNPQQVVDIIRPILEEFPGWIMQNGKYDEHVVRRIGINIQQSHDTMGIEYARDENSRKDLGFLSMVYLGAPEYKEMVDKSDMYNADLELASEYGAKDADYTRRLTQPMLRRLQEDELGYSLYSKLLMPSVNMLTDVEEVGIPIHRGKFKKRWEYVLHKKAKAQETLWTYYGGEFNPNSPKQLGVLLFEKMGLPILEITKAGNASTAEGVLVRLKDHDDSGVMDAILDYRKWMVYESRYFASWDYFMDSRGRIHPNFKPFHTVTGRLSCDNPNMQQVPRDVLVRGLVGGRRGWRILEADYSQAELRIAAHVTQDKTMTRLFNQGRDIHTEMASVLTGKTHDEVTAHERKMAKSVNFGFLYGMGHNRYISYAKENYELDVTVAEAKNARDVYFKQFRGLLPWHDRQRRAAKRRKWVVSPIGRKRRLWDIDSRDKEIRGEAERQAINSPIQSMASDMNLMSMVSLHEQLDQSVCRIIATVHDSILFEVREEAIDDVIPIIVDTMENLPLEETFGCVLTVPIIADIKVGRFWSEDATEVS